ncbi:hypothetical protein PENTCL1PPCAC_3957 [Pristionchus entomophagus]|uniref:CUB domain-containing protein n=1 Tax=Pristionchus entomophagus TaxID=358040 RepID=A0AAV5SGL2_9BILA|nr:hypothetical protein PENTCL1PPCAC_3957 [Pristionchus entomophagus]
MYWRSVLNGNNYDTRDALETNNEVHWQSWSNGTWDNGTDTTYNGLLLGLVCTEDSDYRDIVWQWSDGSPIDYTPPGFEDSIGNYLCGDSYSWYLRPNGFWEDNFKRPPIDVYCTTQLEQPVNDGCEYDPDDGVCYRIGASANSWQDAQAICRNMGADLVSIHSKEENSFVRRMAVAYGAVNGVFLGGTISGKGKEFGWIDGSAWKYDNFYPGFPIDGLGECLTMDTLSAAGQWINVNSSSSFPVACAKKDTVPTCISGPWTEGQIIYSPGYPYDASVSCNYVLTVEAGKRLEVHVKLLEANTCCDRLILTDNYIGGNTIANLTGEISDLTFYSESNIMRVTWQPNGGVNVRGMMITFNAFETIILSTLHP